MTGGRTCPSCGNAAHILSVEYSYGCPDRYDGISEYRCPACGARWGRWSGRVLGETETEPPLGKPRRRGAGQEGESE